MTARVDWFIINRFNVWHLSELRCIAPQITTTTIDFKYYNDPKMKEDTYHPLLSTQLYHIIILYINKSTSTLTLISNNWQFICGNTAIFTFLSHLSIWND